MINRDTLPTRLPPTRLPDELITKMPDSFAPSTLVLGAKVRVKSRCRKEMVTVPPMLKPPMLIVLSKDVENGPNFESRAVKDPNVA